MAVFFALFLMFSIYTLIFFGKYIEHVEGALDSQFKCKT